MNRRSMRLRPAGLTVAGLCIVAALLFPVYWMVVCSFESSRAIFQIPAALLPHPFTMDAYNAVLHDQAPHLLTSLEVALGTVAISLAVAVPAAYALAHFPSRANRTVIFCLWLAQMIPAVTLATPVFLIFTRLGLLNTLPGLMLADSTYAVPFATLVLRAFFQALPYDLAEAALVDGNGDAGAFLRVMLPMAAPGIVTAGLFAFLFAWGDFLYALTIMTTNDIQPISLSMYTYIGQYSTQWNNVMAVASLAALPAAVLLIAFQRFIAGGLTAGALKG
jgi:multiple sugar transport system permease protein